MSAKKNTDQLHSMFVVLGQVKHAGVPQAHEQQDHLHRGQCVQVHI